MLLLEILKQIPFFSSLKEEDSLYLYDKIKLMYYPKDYVIFKEGDLADKMYIIKSGQVKIFHKKNNYEEFIAVLGKNEFFGEMGLISKKSRLASCKTLTETECFCLDHSSLKEVLNKKPEIADMVSDTLIKRVKENRKNF